MSSKISYTLFFTFLLVLNNVFAQQETLKQVSLVDSLVKKGSDLDRASLPDSAIFYYELAAKQTLKERDTADYLVLKVTIANVHGSVGRFDKVFHILDSVALVEANREESKPRFQALNAKSFFLINQRSFDEALVYLDSAGKSNFERKSKEGRMRQARLSLFEAFIYLQTNQLNISEGFFEESLHIYDSLQMNKELAEVLNHYGALKSSLLKGDEAIKYFNRSKELYENEPHVSASLLASLYTNIAEAYQYLGLNRNAVISLKKADELMSSFDQNSINLVVINVGLTDTYLALEEYENALLAIGKALPLAKRLLGETHLYTLRAQYTLGRVFKELGQYDKAYSTLSEGIALFEDDLSEEALHHLSVYTYEKGAVAINLDRPDEGLQLMRNSVAISLRSGADFERGTINIYQELAGAYLLLEEPDSAAFYFQKSLKISNGRRGSAIANPEVIYHEQLYEGIMGRVVSFEMKYRVDKDRQWLDSAYQMLVTAEEKMSYFREFPSDFSKKLEIGEDISNSLQAGISVCYELYKLTNDRRYADHAYLLIEKSKSNQALFDFPVEQLTAESVPDSVLKNEKNLNAAISTLETLLYSELNTEKPDSIAVANYQQQLVEFTDKLVSLKYEIGEEFPNYFLLKYNREYLNIEQTQSQLLVANDQLINYHYQEGEIYIFQIRKTDFEFIKKETSDGFEDNLKGFVSALNQPEFSANALIHYDTIANQLGEELLPNLSSFQPESSLIIVPDGPIHRIPFEVLTKSLGDERRSFNSLDYLIKNHSIRYTTSATMLAYQIKRQNKGKGLLAFAPSFDNNLALQSRGTDSVRTTLGNLIYSKKEVENIEKYFESKVFLDTSATEKAFRSTVADYAIIHLASHGLLDEENSLFSRILFSPHNVDSVNDGVLNNREILGLKIQADMVVLSACNTGSGDLLPGEGVMSLANGFFYAGANSLVMTLWPANDVSTAGIMDSFYKNLSVGHNKSEALREAKLRHLEGADAITSHPYYWAHFTVNGNDKPLVKKALPGYLWFLLLVPLAYFVISRSRNKSAT